VEFRQRNERYTAIPGAGVLVSGECSANRLRWADGKKDARKSTSRVRRSLQLGNGHVVDFL
jgi:hypothetical protein